MHPRTILLCAAIALTSCGAFAGQGNEPSSGFRIGDRLAAPPGSASTGFRELAWEDLAPADKRHEDLLKRYDLSAMSDRDPRAIELMKRLREAWDHAPVIEALDGQHVRIAGFVVPLDSEGDQVREFLLVPYFGACIHVPPPPANQLIHVIPDRPIPGHWSTLPISVSGILSVVRFESEIGNAGYRLQGLKIEQYKLPLPR